LHLPYNEFSKRNLCFLSFRPNHQFRALVDRSIFKAKLATLGRFAWICAYCLAKLSENPILAISEAYATLEVEAQRKSEVRSFYFQILRTFNVVKLLDLRPQRILGVFLSLLVDNQT